MPKRKSYVMEANRARAARAWDALNEYESELDIEGVETALVDLLTDLMHLANERDIDFDDQLRIAQDHFKEEREPWQSL